VQLKCAIYYLYKCAIILQNIAIFCITIIKHMKKAYKKSIQNCIFKTKVKTNSYFVQLTTFITSRCTLEFIIKSLSITIAFIIGLAKYASFRVHIKTVS